MENSNMPEVSVVDVTRHGDYYVDIAFSNGKEITLD